MIAKFVCHNTFNVKKLIHNLKFIIKFYSYSGPFLICFTRMLISRQHGGEECQEDEEGGNHAACLDVGDGGAYWAGLGWSKAGDRFLLLSSPILRRCKPAES